MVKSVFRHAIVIALQNTQRKENKKGRKENKGNKNTGKETR
jgi:hypothetical protein